jgi:hypothetical protein
MRRMPYPHKIWRGEKVLQTQPLCQARRAVQILTTTLVGRMKDLQRWVKGGLE